MNSNTPQGNILVVDDTPANLNILTTFLSERGHKVRPAINGELALKAVAKAQPDVILLDIQMPGLNGFEVCARLKADPETEAIPVIFISALDAIEDKVRAFEVGGVDYITKPFQVLEVLARVESQLRIQWQNRRIEALSAFKDDLIGIVSHDLKNPLNIILNYTNILQEDIADGAPIDPTILGRVERAGMTMLDLVRDLLDNARYERRLPLRMTPTDLNPVVEEQVTAYELPASKKGIQLETALYPEPLVTNLDSRRFAQVVSNLISNAIKYSPEATTVAIRTFYDENWAFVQVQDAGYGIPAEDLPHVFEKFYRVQTQAHLSAEGTGLGLPIAKLIIEEHGGSLTAVSEYGKGSLFTIAIPLGP
jgi:two-component system, sensor histidine kinase and response regulator